MNCNCLKFNCMDNMYMDCIKFCKILNLNFTEIINNINYI